MIISSDSNTTTVPLDIAHLTLLIIVESNMVGVKFAGQKITSPKDGRNISWRGGMVQMNIDTNDILK